MDCHRTIMTICLESVFSIAKCECNSIFNEKLRNKCKGSILPLKREKLFLLVVKMTGTFDAVQVESETISDW